MTFGTQPVARTRPAATLFLLAAVWTVLSLSAGREMTQLVPALWADLVRFTTTAVCLFAGFFAIARMSVPDLRPLSAVGFVRRPGTAVEFGVGAALGWGIAIALVLPALLTGNLTLTFSFDATSLTRMLISLCMLVAFALASQLIVSGLPVRLLVRSVGPGWTTAAVIFVVITVSVFGQAGQGSSLIFVALAAGLFCTAFLRTRALWLPLGLQLGWTVGLYMLFGANSPYSPPTYGIVQSDTGGPAWLTGGPFGPEASLVAVLVLIAALVVLFRVTRDYAWHYTYQPVDGAGYPMDVPPPAEHAREEARQAASQPLVQIGGVPSPKPPSPPEPLI